MAVFAPKEPDGSGSGREWDLESTGSGAGPCIFKKALEGLLKRWTLWPLLVLGLL